MTFDLRIHAQWNVSPCAEVLQDSDLLVESITLSIETLDQVGHGADSIRVKSDTKDHPRDCKESFVNGYDGAVTKADGR